MDKKIQYIPLSLGIITHSMMNHLTVILFILDLQHLPLSPRIDAKMWWAIGEERKGLLFYLFHSLFKETKEEEERGIPFILCVVVRNIDLWGVPLTYTPSLNAFSSSFIIPWAFKDAGQFAQSQHQQTNFALCECISFCYSFCIFLLLDANTIFFV